MARETDFLKGQTAIVTGASGGIGEKICLALAELGVNLIVSGRNAVKLSTLVEKLMDIGVQARACAGDLRDFERVGKPGAVVVPLGRKKDLSLLL